MVLVDKGYCGTSGATAPADTGVWYVAPDPQQRNAAKAGREALGGHLADHHWMDHVLAQTFTNMDRLATERRYPLPIDPSTGAGAHRRSGARVHASYAGVGPAGAGVRTLDHSPALELLVETDGSVRGAAGYQPGLFTGMTQFQMSE